MILRRFFVYFVGCFLPVLTVLHLSLAALLCYVPQRFPCYAMITFSLKSTLFFFGLLRSPRGVG